MSKNGIAMFINGNKYLNYNYSDALGQMSLGASPHSCGAIAGHRASCGCMTSEDFTKILHEILVGVGNVE